MRWKYKETKSEKWDEVQKQEFLSELCRALSDYVI